MEPREIFKRLQQIVIFGGLYLAAFFLMEARAVPIHIIYTKYDRMIPFCEYFIVPYVLWYFYIAATLLYLGLNAGKTKEYYRFIIHMALGMLIFIIVSFAYPNGQNLRPKLVPDNIFKQAVLLLYEIDTSTNILPSLHVFASVACDIALCRDVEFKKRPILQGMSHFLSLSIVLSTMFLKQHSVIDVVAAFLCNAVFYVFIYQWDGLKLKIASRKTIRVIQKS